ncbi:MAG: translational GTPase TypA [Alphaproteobacteria bacterium]|nr:translational GTPase TypA [Alphaproteobacteria bacterium]
MELRNLAIIAHVDHGKTTLVDELLKQSGTFRENQNVDERVMDSNDLEKERGITILAKNTAVEWNNIRMNIVDTPGHADFGGEVERILSMVDGVLLLVDAAEGPMPQTKFVTSKALSLGLKPIVVINKADKPDARPDWVLDQIFDLFVALDASDEQLDFPVIYSSAKLGWAVNDLEDDKKDMQIVFEKISQHISEPNLDTQADFSMLVTTLEADNFLGRILTGRVESGTVKVGDNLQALNLETGLVEKARIAKLLMCKGLEKINVNTASAGDIVSIAGFTKATVADTICSEKVSTPLEALPITPPTMSMTVSVNDSPLVGRDGDKLTGNMIAERLYKEAETNIAIKITQSPQKDALEVAGRGELQLGVLLENMRREGFEMTVAPPRVIFREENGKKHEPMEEVQIDVDEEFSGVVVEKLGKRKAEMKAMVPSGAGKVRLTFEMPARGLIGYQSEFLSDTRGTGILSRSFLGYAPYKGDIEGRREGVLVSQETGKSVAYALANLESRGIMFIDAGVDIYCGMIIGENSKENDLDVNPLKGKQLTNVRASGKDDAVKLTPPKRFTLESAIAYIQSDERVEITPKHIRLRKAHLNINERKRASKGKL